MSNKLIEILKTSSLRSLLSDSEIDEVYEELRADFNDFLEEETERITDEVKGTSEIEDLKYEIKDLEKEIKDLEKKELPHGSILDSMTADWVKNNWEDIVKMQNLNISAKEMINTYLYGKTVMEIGNDCAEEIAKGFNTHILEKVLSMGNTEQLDNAIIKVEHIPSKFCRTDSKRIILVGRAASGKDHMRKQLEKAGYKYAVSYTTRPPRTGEIEGKDYFFLSEEKFKEMIANNEFYEHVSFNNWYYGTTNKQFYNDDVFIMTPHGLSCVKPEDRKNSFVIFFDMKEGIRRRRLMERSDADSVDRRLIADNLDFEGFKDFDIVVKNHDF
jgi:guanylate kinase